MEKKERTLNSPCKGLLLSLSPEQTLYNGDQAPGRDPLLPDPVPKAIGGILSPDC